MASDGDEFAGTEVLSTIISANTNTDVDIVEDKPSTFVSRGYNLIGDGNATAAFNQTTDRIGAHPKLGALSDNGGPTQSHALLSGSPPWTPSRKKPTAAGPPPQKISAA